MTDKFLAIQIGNEDRQFVLPSESINNPDIRKLIEEKDLILQNAKFDLGFFMAHGIFTKGQIYDTMLGERIMTVGTRHKVGLQYMMKKYFNIEMDKSVRNILDDLGFNNPLFQQYAADDIKYLHEIRFKQLVELEKQDLLQCLSLENAFVKVLTYIEFCGFFVNKPKWKQKMIQDVKIMEDQRDLLNEASKKFGLKPYIIEETLFGKHKTQLINWSSPQAVIKVFESLGLDLSIFDKKTKKYKKTVEGKHLGKFKKDCSLVGPYLKFKKAEKTTTSYGMGYLKELNKYPDGRLRTRFKQIMDTGRLSSGSGKVNFQNIPRVPEKDDREKEIYERECFEPEEGNILVTADYSSQESRLLAHFSQDKALLDFYNSGEADLHSYATKLVFTGEHPEMSEMTLKEIKNNFPALRNVMKGFNFALAYGGNANTVSENIGIPIEEALKYEKLYFEAFPGLKNYFKIQSDKSIEQGFILTNDVTRRKIYFKNYDNYENKRQEINAVAPSKGKGSYLGLNSEFWDLWKIEKKKDSDFFREYLKPTLASFFKLRSGMKNASLNYPCQATAADMTKLACIYFYNWIVENNLLNIVKMVNVVHDEICVESPKNLKNKVSEKLIECMENAGDLFSTIKMTADYEAGFLWEH